MEFPNALAARAGRLHMLPRWKSIRCDMAKSGEAAIAASADCSGLPIWQCNWPRVVSDSTKPSTVAPLMA